MTTPAPPGTPAATVPETYDYVGGTPEIDQLLSIEEDLYTKKKAIEDQLNEVQARIKAALTAVTRPVKVPIYNGAEIIGYTDREQPYPAYRISVPGQVARSLKWATSRRLNTPAFKADHPEIYAAYVKESGTWKLEREK